MTRRVLDLNKEVYTSKHSPLDVSADSLYPSDIKESLSSVGSFTGGSILTLFNNLDTSLTATGATNPKYLEVFLERPMRMYEMGLVTKTGSFSNVKIFLKDRQGTVLATIDDSANATTYTSNAYRTTFGKNVCCIRVEFHTVNTITLSFIYARKVLKTESLIMGLDDATGLPVAATFDNGEFIVGGQIKLKTAENDVVGAAHPLQVIPYLEDENGVQGKMLSDNMFLGAPVILNSEHHEIHCGDSFVTSRVVDLGNGASDDLLIVVPNEAGTGQSQILYHLLANIDVETESLVYLYEGPTTSANGTQITSYNRERNSALTAGMSVYYGPTVSATGTQLQVAHLGSGRLVGRSGRSEEFVLKNNTKYLLRVTNLTANNNYISWELNHYRHPGI